MKQLTKTTHVKAPWVAAVSRGAAHTFSKVQEPSIQLLCGLGVAGDAHAGRTVQHRSRIAADPTQPNLRQVHLIQTELLDGLRAEGFGVAAGDLGENITTKGVYLLGLPTGARLRLGPHVVVVVMGLRNPCAQLDTFQPGLLEAVLDRDSEGNVFRKAGVMGVVLTSGEVRPGDAIGTQTAGATQEVRAGLTIKSVDFGLRRRTGADS